MKIRAALQAPITHRRGPEEPDGESGALLMDVRTYDYYAPLWKDTGSRTRVSGCLSGTLPTHSRAFRGYPVYRWILLEFPDSERFGGRKAQHSKGTAQLLSSSTSNV